MSKTKIGHMACPDCGEKVAVKENEHGTMSYSCDECDGNGYCRKGEGRYPSWRAKITPLAGAKPAAESKPASEKPAPAKKSGLDELMS